MGGQARALQDRFAPPLMTGSLDVQERTELCPARGTVKGMFFSAIADEASARKGERVGRERYVAFRGYPLREWLEFLPEAARAAHPSVHPKEGMRRFGRRAFDVFNKSMAGRVLFSMAGLSVPMAVQLTGRAFDVIGSHGRVLVLENEHGRAVFGLRDMYDYIDAWHVGVYQGAMDAFGIGHGEVRVCLDDLGNGDIEVTY